ncbi:hypothetical protein LTR10_023567 [Elasticomyces elasticus]|uniref:Uncharacterized protein n=1 Tax=Exophiala sideris TaxID=1016849 RepID=A0ABR0J6K0_9EURO|nr:hypothetical protein LTR10_023567 [Elasticomyces elasticus]KAK5028757.1 hypothetical protein LTS07_006136 [Exophiala sideris]KAK5035626.1 hypothetical protein LTR13_005755 [Exophiala sideris]KAK5057261.1 hypothetical protein LTR69_007300 [Exophiala sideris]
MSQLNQEDLEQYPNGPLARPTSVIINYERIVTNLEIRVVFNEALATPSLFIAAEDNWTMNHVLKALERNVLQKAKTLMDCSNIEPIFFLQETVWIRDWMKVTPDQRTTFRTWWVRNCKPSLGRQTVKIEVHMGLKQRVKRFYWSIPWLDVYRPYELLEEEDESEVASNGIEMMDVDDEEEDDDDSEGFWALSTSDWLRS